MIGFIRRWFERRKNIKARLARERYLEELRVRNPMAYFVEMCIQEQSHAIERAIMSPTVELTEAEQKSFSGLKKLAKINS